MKKRLLSALLSGALLGTLFLGGCGSGETQTQNSTETAASTAVSESEGKTYRGNDVSEPVTIKMYLIGDRTPDFDLVYDEVNKKLEETVNATVEVEFLSWAEHDTKYSLLFSSGEDFDLIFTATGWAHYSETANMGDFMSLHRNSFLLTLRTSRQWHRKMPGNRPKSTEKFIWCPVIKMSTRAAATSW